MIYNDYIKSLSDKFSRRLDDISAEHNFEYGNEFEIAICEILREFLPSKYGICRGFIVNSSGKKAGDDIIVFDQERFPTLKLHKRDNYSRLENIPAEAVYAYIEAKHTLNSKSLKKAIAQIKKVKQICSKRHKVGISQMDPYINSNVFDISAGSCFPDYRNPVFTLILTRFIEDDNKSRGFDSVFKFLTDEILSIVKNKTPFLPDMVVAGNDLYVGVFNKEKLNAEEYLQPTIFLIASQNYTMHTFSTKGYAFGFGLAKMFAALDWIRLGKMPWADMLSEVMKVDKIK